jgi:hypothetical protein
MSADPILPALTTDPRPGDHVETGVRGDDDMRLARNNSADGRGKYDIIDNRTGLRFESKVGSSEEFFVIKLKDQHAYAALRAYADDVMLVGGDIEYADEIYEMAMRAEQMPNRKLPD